MKIIIPTTLNDITVRQFIKYNNIISIDNVDEDTLLIGTIACFCNLSVEDVLKIDSKDLRPIFDTIITTLQSQPRDIEIHSNYGRIPNLDNISAGEYIDLDKYIAEIENIPQWLSVLYRPIKNKIGSQYSIEPYSGTENINLDTYLDFPIEVYLSAKVFFWNLGTELLTATRDYLQQPTAELQLLDSHLAKNGAGIHQFIQSLEMTISSLKTQLV